ncbi:MAG: epoxyqueuosine reductase [Candidatus Lokiarchaeota archaeon]|nr:epoxyqueuosine reductase [Candidatus Lokiarchaeota archaeon]
MERDQKLTKEIITLSNKIGIDIIGFADPKWYIRYKEEHRPNNYLKNVRTVIIIGIHLYDIILDAWSLDLTIGKSFHYLDSILENRAHNIKDFLLKKGFNSKIIPYGPGLFLKDSAALAGLGPIGKNNLFISKKFGCQVRLRAIVTEAPLITGVPIENSEYCRDCNICFSKCPAGALTKDGYNRQACESYCLSNLNKLSKYTSIWCNICIEACPHSKKCDLI